MPTQGELAWGGMDHWVMPGWMRWLPTCLASPTQLSTWRTLNDMRVDMHQRPVNYKTAARSFCKQTCFSRFYFWDRKLSCKVASLQWASLVLQAAGDGCSDLHTVPCDGRDVRDDPSLLNRICARCWLTWSHPWAGSCWRDTSWGTCLPNSFVGFSSHPDLSARYGVATTWRLSCRPSAAAPTTLDQRWAGATASTRPTGCRACGQICVWSLCWLSCHLPAHRGRSYLALQRSECCPHVSPWNLCATGNLGSMESNVMAGRALFGRFQLTDRLRRCAIF